MVYLTNCTFDGHIYNTRRVMEECLAIKPDLIFLWDEAWFGFARFSPFLRPRTAMGAASDIETWLRDPMALVQYEKQRAELAVEQATRETRRAHDQTGRARDALAALVAQLRSLEDRPDLSDATGDLLQTAAAALDALVREDRMPAAVDDPGLVDTVRRLGVGRRTIRPAGVGE